MTQPIWIKEMLNRLDADLKEDFEERAAIMQYDGGLSRYHAECLALLNILRKNPMTLMGLSVLKTELDGDIKFIVTTNAKVTHQCLSTSGRQITELSDLKSVLDSEFYGMATLAKLAILFE